MHLEFRHPNSKCARLAFGGWATQWLEPAYSKQSVGHASARAASHICHAESVGASAVGIKMP
jgi:hypothetical protein